VGEHRPPAARPRVGGTGGYALGDEQRVSWQELLAQSRDDGKRFSVYADEELSAFVELERQVLTVTLYLESIQADS
jgi:hypothetical protein